MVLMELRRFSLLVVAESSCLACCSSWPLSGAEQTVVTDLDEAWWEDMLEEAADELLGGDGATLELVSGRLFVSESDLALMRVGGGGCC